MEPLLDVVGVEARPNRTLVLEFENGERRLFDMVPFLDRKPFSVLAAGPLFLRARIESGTVVWPGNLDIAPETLYDLSQPIRL